MNLKSPKFYTSHGDGSFSLKDFRGLGKKVIFEKGVKIFHPENIEIGNLEIMYMSVIIQF